MTTVASSESPPVQQAEPDPRRWLALVIIAIAQLMIVVDASIVNIALPKAQIALHISNADRQWVVTAYTLAFGGMLLLGGRIADYSGRKRAMIISLIGFAAASALGGLAVNEAMLLIARAVQGAFAAVMAPAALSLLSVTFSDPKERAKAFGVYGSIAGGGLALGLILGGVLTEYASWRWCLLVNAPIAVIAAVAGTLIIKESSSDTKGRYDILGAAFSIGGLVALVYGFTEASTDGWGSGLTLGLLAVGVVLLVAFVLYERRAPEPLLPLRVVTQRSRAGSFLTSLLMGLAMFGMFLFLTYYLQDVLGYSPLKSGFAFLPFSVGIVVSAAVASTLLTRFAPRTIMLVGLAMAVVGMLWFTQISVNGSYWEHIFPAELVMSLGMGLVFVPISSTSLVGVAAGDSGVASAMINTTQQVGGSIGTALLNTIATSTAATYVADHLRSAAIHHTAVSQAAVAAHGEVHGFTVAFAASAGFTALALVLTALLVNARKEDLSTEGAMVMG